MVAFKKGPDYIDAAWHSVATGSPCYCLDVFLMGEESAARQFADKEPRNGVAVIEGNRGLFDGFDNKGSYSTAELAKLIKSPVLLVIDLTKMTRTAAALVLGSIKLDPDLKIGGVVLNRVAGARHARIATEAIEQVTGVPVLGVVPKLPKIQAPERHLGLVTPEETPDAEEWVLEMGRQIEPHLDMDRIEAMAFSAGDHGLSGGAMDAVKRASRPVRIGVIRDSAFPFYYAENVESLARAGADLVWIKSVDDPELPELDALYIGGGFPETHARLLSGADRLRRSLQKAVAKGLPVYAECGGSVYLGRTLKYKGETFEMAGIIPVDFEFCTRPQGHGYTEWVADKKNPFYEVGAAIRGHEFHYTRASSVDAGADSAFRIERGEGFGSGREGIMRGNVLAMYGHVHALGCPEWVNGMITAAESHSLGR